MLANKNKKLINDLGHENFSSIAKVILRNDFNCKLKWV